MADNRLGAFPEQWIHFAETLGLEQDLLPVVCNLGAVIHANSKIKLLGKTPTKYADNGHVVGIPAWTEHISARKDIVAWSKNPDYGICVQSRTLRAIDIDVSDTSIANTIEEAVFAFLGEILPKRSRPNSGKSLLMVRVEGLLPKAVIKCNGGMIERLGNGQQFLVAGTHPSGVKYGIEGGLPDTVPEVSLELFLALWKHLEERFSLEAPTVEGTHLPRRLGETVECEDNVAEYLLEQGLVLCERKDSLDIECPWAEGHSTAGDPTSSTWMKAGTSGYEQGHYKCLHASCSKRTRDGFLAKIGYAIKGLVDETDAITTFNTLSGLKEAPSFIRDGKGIITSNLLNVLKALDNPDWLGKKVHYDSFLGELYLTDLNKKTVAPFEDADYVDLRADLQILGFAPIDGRMMRDCVVSHAKRHQVDSAIEWLNSLVWDGVERVSSFTHAYVSAEDSAYSTAVSRYMWSAMAGRVLNPGVQADMVPIWISKQGTGKTSTLRALAPDKKQYATIDLSQGDDTLARLMRGKLVCELGELKGMQSRGWSSLNDFITRTDDTWVPKFKEFSTTYPRRSLFIGTSNPDDILSDPTGHRRWLPVRLKGTVDVEAIERDKDQLWAEAAVLYRLGGVCYQDAERLAALVHQSHRSIDPWEPIIGDWLMCRDLDKPIKLMELLEESVGVMAKDLKKDTQSRVDSILRGFGFTYDVGVGGWVC